MTATSGSLDPIPWADLAVEHRATLDARLAAVMGETDPAGHWQAMRPEDQRGVVMAGGTSRRGEGGVRSRVAAAERGR